MNMSEFKNVIVDKHGYESVKDSRLTENQYKNLISKFMKKKKLKDYGVTIIV